MSGPACEPILWKGNLHAKGGPAYPTANNTLTMDKEYWQSVPGENHCSFVRRMSTHAAH
jgi:hypothetical protein